VRTVTINEADPPYTCEDVIKMVSNEYPKETKSALLSPSIVKFLESFEIYSIAYLRYVLYTLIRKSENINSFKDGNNVFTGEMSQECVSKGEKRNASILCDEYSKLLFRFNGANQKHQSMIFKVLSPQLINRHS
jgi:hypothetical protein